MTAALIIPMTTSVSSAQSSFISGSSGLSSPDTNDGSRAKELERTAERAIIDAGGTQTIAEEASANELLRDAINGRLVFEDSYYYRLRGPSGLVTKAVVRIPIARFDEYLMEVEDSLVEDASLMYFGAAAGRDENYYYLAISVAYRSM